MFRFDGTEFLPNGRDGINKRLLNLPQLFVEFSIALIRIDVNVVETVFEHAFGEPQSADRLRGDSGVLKGCDPIGIEKSLEKDHYVCVQTDPDQHFVLESSVGALVRVVGGNDAEDMVHADRLEMSAQCQGLGYPRCEMSDTVCGGYIFINLPMDAAGLIEAGYSRALNLHRGPALILMVSLGSLISSSAGRYSVLIVRPLTS